MTISVLANLWVVLVMLMRKRRCKSTHIFILTLAICDILYSTCIHPFLISVSFGADPHELFGEIGCNWYGFGAVFFGSLSMCIHGAVSFTRYKIIVCSGDRKFWKLLRIKVWRTNCFPPAFEFWTTAEVINDVVKGAKIQISLNVYVKKCGSKQIHNLTPFSTSLPTSAEECQKFKNSPRHFEIENVRNEVVIWS